MGEHELTSDDVRTALLWVVERLLADPQPDRCNRCGHSGRHHLASLGNLGPDGMAFRCEFPLPDSPVVRLCTCPDYVHYEPKEGEGDE